MGFVTDDEIEDEWEAYQKADSAPVAEYPTMEIPGWVLRREVYEGREIVPECESFEEFMAKVLSDPDIPF